MIGMTKKKLKRKQHDKLRSGHLCTAVMPGNICWVDKLIYGGHHTNIDELCSIPFTGKGSIMTIIK